jgi:hypothetical protein
MRGVASAIAVGAALLLGGGAYAQGAGSGDAGSVPEAAGNSPFGSFNIRGLIRNETSISTSNHDEYAGTNAGDLKNKRDINLLAVRAEASIYWRYNPQLTGFMKVRAWTDWANKVDDAYPNHLDTQAGNRGMGLFNLTKTGNNWLVDIPQAYVDWRPGPFWVRVGKQQIAWAEALLLNTTDVIDGLDLRRHFFIDVLGEELADERIGNDGIRGGISLGKTGWELEYFFTDFHPSIFPENCSPYSAFPCASRSGPIPRVRDHDAVRHVRTKWDYGGRLHGNIGEVEAWVGYISRPNANGIFIPGNAAGTELTRKFPRERIAMWGFNYLYMSQSGNSVFDGLVMRWDGSWTFNKKIMDADTGQIHNKGQISTAIQMEKQVRWSLRQPSMFLFAQPIWFRTVSAPYSGAYLPDKGRSHFIYSAIGFQQQIGNGSLRYDFVTAHDWAGGELTQTGFLWKPSGKYQVDVYYSDFRGDATCEFGSSTFGHFDELFFRLTRYF